jgi:PmbA protein
VELDPILDALRSAKPAGGGIADWSLHATTGRRAWLGVKDRQTGNAHAPLAFSQSCGARYLIVWSDGLVSRGLLERRQLEQEVDEALASARAAAYEDADAAHVLGPAEMPDVELYDPRAAEIADGDETLFASRLARVRERIDAGDWRTWSGSLSAGAGSARLVTSAGLDVEDSGTSFGWHVSVNGEVGDGWSARAPEEDAAFERRLARLFDTATELQRESEPMAGGMHPVILHPRVVEQYVLTTLLHNLDGATIDHGEGHFRLEQFGSERPALREDLGLRLDPLAPLCSGSYRFTGEGLPAARSVFIERGRLVRPVLDLKYARRLGLEPTPRPYAADVLHLEGPPKLALAEARARAGGGALILSVLGVHTQDRASGDFSLAAPQVLRIGEEGFSGRLRATLSGNLFDVLCEDELHRVEFDGEHTPGLLFPCHLEPT